MLGQMRGWRKKFLGQFWGGEIRDTLQNRFSTGRNVKSERFALRRER
jgi:hypothetical protein